MAGSVVLVVGSGGREHSICKQLAPSQLVAEVHCTPGNAGTRHFATNHSVSATDVSGLVELATILAADLVIAGPEAPLCVGLADALSLVNIPCFGPVAKLANLEGSKLHAKQVMRDAGVPTADFHVLDSESDIDAALDEFSQNPWVVKRDVLAGGKGVVVTSDRAEAKAFISASIISDGKVLLENFLPGEEASMLVIMDGTDYVTLPCSQDHKRAYDGDIGPNTGGMGAYCPAPVVTEIVHQRAIQRIVEPMHKYLSNQEIPYRGVLFVGLMITESGDPNVVEFNVRFGDPECQITLPLISSDLYTLLYSAATDGLIEQETTFHDKQALTVVLAAEGYPATPVKGRSIDGLIVEDIVSENGTTWVNFAGVGVDENGGYISTGGRVLSCSAIADTLVEARTLAYQLISRIKLDGSHYRTDIGHRAL
ncbi:MAG: phosphoribosylamine--glycine ligase [Euryarchaeota archaeon]|jgi:phosphoribosylamine--glycine ligase|nr:phosphoribosylamine--glycine ligase [Euryarchaeota archaeon]MBT5254829.1 phosphoribosylamine--glycine ligase [Euryarchaeota archaeon]